MTPQDELPEPETAAGAGADRLEKYVRDRFAREDSHLRAIRQAMEAEGLPTIQVPAVTGRALQLLLRTIGAERVLEVGTLGGYSALWIARVLPSPKEGRAIPLLTLELEEDRAARARALLAEAGVGDRVEVREGDAGRILAELGPDGSFDAVFLDANKEALVDYIQEAKRLLRPGGLLIVDNALWKGRVADASERDPATVAIRRSHDLVADDPELDGTILPVGDGLLVAVRV